MAIKKRYGIIGVIGNREQGKSTFMVRHLIRELQSKTNYTHGYCNLHVTWPGIEFLDYENLKTLHAENKSGVPTMIVGLDQIHKYMDARRALSKKNVEFSDVLIESRQHGFDLIYTTWARTSVDPRLRKFTELWVQAQRTPQGFLYTYIETETGSVIGQKILTYQEAAHTWKYFETTELVSDYEVE